MPRQQFFYWFLSVDLSKIMHRYAILPGVASTRDQTAPMHQVGARRQILFLDGTSAVEEITGSDPPRSLDYRVFDLTGIFRLLVRPGEARIVFDAPSTNETAVEWRYTFHGHNRLAEAVLRAFVSLFWRGFMNATLRRAKRLAEAPAAFTAGGVAA